jgi:hypothetical protein
MTNLVGGGRIRKKIGLPSRLEKARDFKFSQEDKKGSGYDRTNL